MENQTQATEATEPIDEMLDLEPWARPVAKQYGRVMFAVVMNSGLAAHAMQILNAQAQKHQSRQLAQAGMQLAGAFNQVANALVREKGWDEGTLAQCNRDIELAFAQRVAVAKGSAIILNG